MFKLPPLCPVINKIRIIARFENDFNLLAKIFKKDKRIIHAKNDIPTNINQITYVGIGFLQYKVQFEQETIQIKHLLLKI